MPKTKKATAEKEEQLTLRLPVSEKRRFKAYAAARGTTMQELFREFVRSLLKKRSSP